MTPHALLFTLAAIGIAEAVYLIRKRMAMEKPVCILGEECHVVLESKYNKIFGVHNDVLGLAFYITVSFITAFLVIGVEPIVLWVLLANLAIGGGAVMSFFLVYLQWRVIKAWCIWCVMSALTIFFMGLILLTSTLILP